MHAAFSSSDIRDCNKKLKSPFPGPGSYIDVNNPLHSSIRSAIIQNNAEEKSQQEQDGIKLGAFGSNADRFAQSWLKPKEGPDPGAYISPLVKVNKAHKTKIDLAIEGKSNASTRAFTAAEKERTKVNSIFLSTTDRFAKLEA